MRMRWWLSWIQNGTIPHRVTANLTADVLRHFCRNHLSSNRRICKCLSLIMQSNAKSAKGHSIMYQRGTSFGILRSLRSFYHREYKMHCMYYYIHRVDHWLTHWCLISINLPQRFGVAHIPLPIQQPTITSVHLRGWKKNLKNGLSTHKVTLYVPGLLRSVYFVLLMTDNDGLHFVVRRKLS